ncbi:MAG TPA: tryptophan 7-halogenase, partial [Sphingomicrobium sp.]|nr:tryptophan 7-halogenase [Sphingomicrobium sp.]
TERDSSPFWRHVRDMEVPDTLREKMDLFRRRGRVVKHTEGIFLDGSWVGVLMGQGVVPNGHDLRAGVPPTGALKRALHSLRQEVFAAASEMPDHRELIERYCPMAEAA